MKVPLPDGGAEHDRQTERPVLHHLQPICWPSTKAPLRKNWTPSSTRASSTAWGGRGNETMKQIEPFTDSRFNGICVHCGEILGNNDYNREHIPTKSLINPPYPENLPTVHVHNECNLNFSLDEEYFGAFLASVICGTTEPDSERFPAAATALQHSAGLRTRINQSRQVQGTPPNILWSPEIDRANRVLVKNARAHIRFELGELALSEPSSIGVSPISLLSASQRRDFENTPKGYLWPEVGSRMMTRMASGELQLSGWVEVQSDIYRYAVCQTHRGVLVRMVLREYLAAEVSWDGTSI